MKYLPFLLFLFWITGCGSNPSTIVDYDNDLSMNVSDLHRIEFLKKDATLVYSDFDFEPGCIDNWTADGAGLYWYTPEKYDFVEDDIIACCIYYEVGEYWNLVLTNAFYFCGEENWQSCIYSNVVDFGGLPPVPDYGWLVGVEYRAISRSAEVDWASKLQMSGHRIYCGSPLSGRPDCFKMNMELN